MNAQQEHLRRLRRDALACLTKALAAVDPEVMVAESLEFARSEIKIKGIRFPLQESEIHLLAVGKAAVPMARAVSRQVPIASGLAVVSGTISVPLGAPLRTIAGSHPLPDEGSLRAGRAALELADSLRASDVLVLLISGGASAMLEATPVPLEDLRTCYARLLRSGLDIRRINEVRKGLSNVKGGRLAERAASRGARVISLVISDIAGNPIDDIGSGLTAPSSSRGGRAKAILVEAGLWEDMPESVRQMLTAASAEKGMWNDTTGRIHAFIVGDNECACRAAAVEAQARGYGSRILTTSLAGEAREAGPSLVSSILSWHEPAPKRAAIAGGETTVTVRGDGRGGRNQELALAVVEALEGMPAVLVSCGTDGIDGNSDAAGAIVDGDTIARARAKGLDPQAFLERNNSFAFFAALGDLIMTGPTGTNVGDVQIFLEDRSKRPA